MAEARKLAGSVSAESEVTPRRSFSRNIFLQEGERVKVFAPSCRHNSKGVSQKAAACANLQPGHPLTSSGRLSVPMEMRELYSCSRSCRACGAEERGSFMS